MVHIAPVKWAQRSDSIYVTICLPDVTEEKIDLDAEHLAFKCVGVCAHVLCMCAIEKERKGAVNMPHV